ncbi:MAG: recombination protein RecR [Magnetococcales bacterium]|nr:recombination protein RecR [Magnetococcales bacterium]PPR19464.1 MAG: Recombination protein RecR [Pseudomonadota bacterium]|tara:strand:- start:471 stop:1070 length:600 start_codon:yes stop_codon:yes gene_type:complete
MSDTKMQPFDQLVRELSSLPGFGKRSAQRAALSLLKNRSKINKLIHNLKEVDDKVEECQTCGNLSLSNPCHLCTNQERNQSVICVVEGVDDLWAMERSEFFDGVYHVLGGVVSAIDGIGPDDLRFKELLQRIENTNISEVILALGASVDGSTTGHLLARRLKEKGVKVTTLARGMPMGSEVDYLDAGTLTLALNGRMEI